MLFNSYIFISVFLPITLIGFYILRRFSCDLPVYWLLMASLVFYGYWNPAYLLLLGSSIIFNYVISLWLTKNQSRLILILSVAINLLSIGYFKYSEFLVNNIAGVENTPEFISTIILPLAISFFTFQQIAYQVDIQSGKASPSGFLNYSLYVSLFPQLIAGPIVRFQQLSPQLNFPIRRGSFFPKIALIGIILFAMGLFKKVVWADTFAVYANDVFAKAGDSFSKIGFYDAWIGAYTYSFQLYFDFSGYSDMAIGLALMLGLKFPINFFSPYKAINIIDFWQRWHITLTSFFRDYLYIPLGGNRKGRFRQILNIAIVMLLTGLWHGAGWSFIAWGAYHGGLVIVTHLVRKRLSRGSTYLLGKIRNTLIRNGFNFIIQSILWIITFHLVVLGWVMFRAETLNEAVVMFNGMFLQSGNKMLAFSDMSRYMIVVFLLLAAAFVVIVLPNSIQSIEKFTRWKEYLAQNLKSQISWHWRLSPLNGLFLGVLIYFSITTLSHVSSDFLYFNF